MVDEFLSDEESARAIEEDLAAIRINTAPLIERFGSYIPNDATVEQREAIAVLLANQWYYFKQLEEEQPGNLLFRALSIRFGKDFVEQVLTKLAAALAKCELFGKVSVQPMASPIGAAVYDAVSPRSGKLTKRISEVMSKPRGLGPPADLDKTIQMAMDVQVHDLLWYGTVGTTPKDVIWCPYRIQFYYYPDGAGHTANSFRYESKKASAETSFRAGAITEQECGQLLAAALAERLATEIQLVDQNRFTTWATVRYAKFIVSAASTV